MQERMQVLVTGGAGFIGANVARVLSSQHAARVRVLDDLSSGDERNLEGIEVDLAVGSILDADLLRHAVNGADAVIHLAARPSVPRSLEDPLATHEVNATGTVRVLEAAREAGNLHTVVASSSSVYGANPLLPKSEDLLPEPVSPYAASKLATEAYALAWSASFGLPVLAFRFFNVFGPLQPAGHAYAAVIPAFVSAALGGRPLPVHGDGYQSRDFTFVGDVAAVLASAAVRRVTAARPVNLAFGGRSTLLEVVGLLEVILGRDLPVEYLPSRPGDVRHSQAEQSRLRELFPFLQPTPLEDGLRKTVGWYAETAAPA